MQPRSDPRRGPILSHLKHPADSLRPRPLAPPRDKGTGERGILKIIEMASLSTPRTPKA